MSFKEDLSEALVKAVGFYNAGSDPNEAIVKSAQEMGFNVDQTDRLVEKFNTARTINYFERNPDDRTAGFDLASKEKVAECLYGGKTEKKASADADEWHDYSSYDRREDDYFRTSEKRAGAEAFDYERDNRHGVSGYSTESLQRLVIKRASDHDAMAKSIREQCGMIRDGVVTELSKIASSVVSGYDPEKRYAAFRAVCSGIPAFASFDGLVPDRVKKAAAGEGRSLSRMNVVDLGDMQKSADELSRISEIMSDVERFEKEAERHESYRRNILSNLEKIAVGKDGKKGWDKDDSYEAAREFLQMGSTIAGAAKKTVGAAKDTSERIAGKGLSDYIDTGFLGSREEIEKALAPSKKKDRSLADYVNNLRRSTILQDLYENDPILQDADPKALADAYSTVVQTSPEMSLNKELVRAVLRQSVNSMAVSPFDAKQWADLDNVMRKNRGMAEGKYHDEGSK